MHSTLHRASLGLVLTESVANAGFRVNGMAGGAGYDCAAGTRCRSNADCAYSLVCGPGGTCATP